MQAEGLPSRAFDLPRSRTPGDQSGCSQAAFPSLNDVGPLVGTLVEPRLGIDRGEPLPHLCESARHRRQPPLTTVSLPVEQAGTLAMESLRKMRRGEPVTDRVVLDVELVARASCGCNS